MQCCLKSCVQDFRVTAVLTEQTGIPNIFAFVTSALFVYCLYDLILYVPVNNFLVMSGRVCLG